MHPAPPAPRLATRCAIYTRKSTEAGLDREASSLQTQRETCSSYIRSQEHRGWVELNQPYDDGGNSGGTLNRPALQRLLADVELGRVDLIVIYKIDRLTRSLVDFVRLIDTFERFRVSFVSVTQAFDTSDSMGRLVLNVLLTFAQFERELIGDRIRDKIATLRRRGKFVGGNIPFGYDKPGDRLVVNEAEAAIVRRIYDEYPRAPSGNQLLQRLFREGLKSKVRVTRAGTTIGGNPFNAGLFHRILTNPTYLGVVAHGGEWYPGEQPAIVTREQWDAVQAVRAERHAAQIPRDPTHCLLLGFLYDEHGRRMRNGQRSPEGRKTYRYYVSEKTQAGRRAGLKAVSVHGDDIENLTLAGLQATLVDRGQVTQIVTSLGHYDRETARLLDAAPVAARRLGHLDRRQLRSIYEACIKRAEVSRTELLLIVSCNEICRLIEWDGIGRFRQGASTPTKQETLVHAIRVPAHLVREHRHFTLPIRKREAVGYPDRSLVSLLERAAYARGLVLSNRDRSVDELAREMEVGPSYFARLLRLNYLAPDIQTAIVDGSHPPGLTPKQLIYGSLPLDWEQQRQVLRIR